MNDEDEYARRSYGANSIGFGESPGIAVVDFQKGFTDPDFILGGAPLVMRAMQNTITLLDYARQHKIPVVNSSTAYRSQKEMPYWKIDAVKRHFLIGQAATEFDPRTYDPQHDLAIYKTAPSIFFNTSAREYFTKHRVDTVIITGCNTSGCIRASAVDSFSMCFRTLIPEDCVGDVDELPHRNTLRDLDRRYADVTTLQRVLQQLNTWHNRNLAP